MALVARSAKARGLAVVVVGQSPLPRQGPYAVPDGVVDEFVPIAGWSDADGVRAALDDLHGRYDVVGTYAAFEAALPYDAEFRDLLGLPTSGAATLDAALDKARVRDRLRAAGLSRLRSTTLSGALLWDTWGFDGPAILKPVHGTGSALCYTVDSLDALRTAAADIERTTLDAGMTRDYVLRTGEFVLEQKAQGELLSVESLVYGGEVNVIGMLGRYVLADDPVVEQAAVFPYRHPRYDEIAEAAVAFHRCLGITHGPTHLEVMVPDDGPVELIDFNLRVAGAGAVLAFSEVLRSPYEELLTDLACGVAPDLAGLHPVRWAAECLVLPRPGTTELRDITVPPAARHVRITKEIGARLTGRSDQLDSVTLFVVTAGSAEELHTALMDARRNTIVNGEPLGDNPNNRLIAPAHLRTPVGVGV
ncbi:acetyl-CoA carboxylase biotin carboxylase subunit family protein [Streptomyces sp. NPDC018833]|uniref:acetyl-CoA carboxylase biotin carboxylase subunit family protein n=1 Tax=Streptomyces sp. NPDC018833 TaxID=3365053 RepID=UPI0037AEEA2A